MLFSIIYLSLFHYLRQLEDSPKNPLSTLALRFSRLCRHIPEAWVLSTYRFKHSSGTGAYHHGGGGVRGLGRGNTGGDGEGKPQQKQKTWCAEWLGMVINIEREVCKETKRSHAVWQPQSHNATLRSAGTGRAEEEKHVLVREIPHQLLWWKQQQLWCCITSHLISQVVVSLLFI